MQLIQLQFEGFEPLSGLAELAFRRQALVLGFQGLADRMVDDFVRVADAGGGDRSPR